MLLNPTDWSFQRWKISLYRYNLVKIIFINVNASFSVTKHSPKHVRPAIFSFPFKLKNTQLFLKSIDLRGMKWSWNIHKLWRKVVHSAWEHVQVQWLKAHVDSHQPYAKISQRSKMYKQKLSSGWPLEVDKWNRNLRNFPSCTLSLFLSAVATYSGHVYMMTYIMLIMSWIFCLHSMQSFCDFSMCQHVLCYHTRYKKVCTNVTVINLCCFNALAGPSLPLCAPFSNLSPSGQQNLVY